MVAVSLKKKKKKKKKKKNIIFFFFKQKTAYEMCDSDWSSDVCSSDLTSRSRETGGVGLGLAIARTIVHAHGGEISLANRPEGGLRATLRLPLPHR